MEMLSAALDWFRRETPCRRLLYKPVPHIYHTQPAEEDLYEVKRKGDKVDDLDVGYFITFAELDQYDEDERVRVDENDPASPLRVHEKGKFIYRLAGREREKSASYYTPEVLTKCLVKYALKELLEGKTADEILQLTVCEKTLSTLIQTNETYESTQIDAFFESKPKIDAFLKIDANAQRKEYKMAS